MVYYYDIICLEKKNVEHDLEVAAELQEKIDAEEAEGQQTEIPVNNYTTCHRLPNMHFRILNSGGIF